MVIGFNIGFISILDVDWFISVLSTPHGHILFRNSAR